MALSFSALWTFIYIFNKATDGREDSVNLAGFPIDQSSYKKTFLVSYVFLLVPPLFYQTAISPVNIQAIDQTLEKKRLALLFLHII
jgi:hypothetical protein